MNHLIDQNVVTNGRIRQSVCRWCYSKIPLPTFASEIARIGLRSIDLLTPDEFQPLKEHGLTCTMTSGACAIDVGLNRTENHAAIFDKLRRIIELTADAGFPNVIVFSGNRTAPNLRDISDDEGLSNCTAALKQVVGLAEQRKVTICMELLNSRRNHPHYMCDRTAWGVALCKGVGSERLKLLYDIYHMQIMEGDVIQTLRDNIQYIGHVHTGGVPGRHEIDETQELNYPAIMRALIELKFDGIVAQEFLPTQEPMESLANAVRICDV